MSALNPSRNATRVQAPPGGYSTIAFGSDPPPQSPRKVATAPPVPAEPEPASTAPGKEPEAPGVDKDGAAPAEAAEAVDDGPSLEMLKLQAIGAVAAAQDSPDVREAITTMLKHLQIAAGANKAGAGGAAAEPSSEAPLMDAALAAFKAALKLRGTHGIISIGRRFRSMDDNGDNKVAYDEFKKALIEMKLGLSEADTMRLFRQFDKDASGYLSFNELLFGLRGELNERRLDMVKRCFKVLDVTGDGKVTLADLERRYDASRHPDVVAGTKAPRAVLLEFLGTFEAAGGGTAGDGQVEFEEFKAYYALVSANIDEGKNGDDYFELMMRNVWHVSGGEGWCANTTCKRVLVVFEDDTQKVVELTDDFDVDVKDLAAVKAKLAQQGITDIKSVALYGDMTSTESGSGPSTSASSPGPSAASPGPADSSPAAAGFSPGPGSRPSTGRRNPDHNRSSIVFG